MTSTFALPDSRVLAYIDYGIESACDGQPGSWPSLFYFHGFPGSRLEGALLVSAAKRYHVRLISMDRPGMGLSTLQPGRNLLDWPSDVEALADHLQIHAFYVVAASGGSPYALACAKAMRRERLLGVGIIAGIYPLSLGTQDMSVENRIFLWTASSRLASPLVAPLMDWMLGKTARDSKHPERLHELFAKSMSTKPAPDLRCLQDLEATEKIVEALRESFVQGSTGVAEDIKIISGPWGFELSDIDTQGLKICIWHGRMDANVPVSLAEKAAAKIQGAELRILEGEAHLSASFNHHGDLLATLLS
ncbi:hypothetical protein KCU88_g7468, partial [Aureobasidium melanogenum]